MAEQMAPAAEPSLSLGGLEGAKESLGGPSQMAGGMEEIEHADSGRKASAVDPPEAASAIAEPDYDRSGVHPRVRLLSSFRS